MNQGSDRGRAFPRGEVDRKFFQERNCDGCGRVTAACPLIALSQNNRIPDAWVYEPISRRCSEKITPAQKRKMDKERDAALVAASQDELF